MEFLEFKELYNELSDRYMEICKYLDLDEINNKLNKFKNMTLKENFWSNKDEAANTLKTISRFEYDLNSFGVRFQLKTETGLVLFLHSNVQFV